MPDRYCPTNIDGVISPDDRMAVFTKAFPASMVGQKSDQSHLSQTQSSEVSMEN